MKVFLITNESINFNKKNFFCDNKDIKTTPEGFNKRFNTILIGRGSKEKRSHKIDLKDVKVFNNIFLYLYGIYKTFIYKDSKYVIVSISPFTFLACVLIRFFKTKPFVYLRSDGYEEYKHILGFPWVIAYHLMFIITAKISYLISCEKKILKGKPGKIIFPSQINSIWLKNRTKINKKKIKILYVGRISKEKGIISLINSLSKSEENFTLNIVGTNKNNFYCNNSNIKFYEQEIDEKKLIKFYDDCNIFILPSFTEGHPMVIYEALARFRPIILFKEIIHVKKNKKGIFLAERNKNSIFKTIKFIFKNYDSIYKEMKTNRLILNEEYLYKFSKILLKKN